LSIRADVRGAEKIALLARPDPVAAAPARARGCCFILLRSQDAIDRTIAGAGMNEKATRRWPLVLSPVSGSAGLDGQVVVDGGDALDVFGQFSGVLTRAGRRCRAGQRDHAVLCVHLDL